MIAVHGFAGVAFGFVSSEKFFFQTQKIAARSSDMSYIVSAGVLEKADSVIKNL